jgi:hypothetical protein
MSITVQTGTWAGQPLRVARKPHRCDYWHGLERGKCAAIILPGDYYLQGEMNDSAGGWGYDRYCMECAGEEARQSLPKVAA